MDGRPIIIFYDVGQSTSRKLIDSILLARKVPSVKDMVTSPIGIKGAPENLTKHVFTGLISSPNFICLKQW